MLAQQKCTLELVKKLWQNTSDITVVEKNGREKNWCSIKGIKTSQLLNLQLGIDHNWKQSILREVKEWIENSTETSFSDSEDMVLGGCRYIQNQ